MTYLTITIPKDARVLLLEDSPMRVAWFRGRVPNLTVVKTVQEFKDFFATKPICDYIFYDHDLGVNAESGLEAAKFIREHFGSMTNAGLIHTWNEAGAARMRALLPLIPWIPFGQFEVKAEEDEEAWPATTK